MSSDENSRIPNPSQNDFRRGPKVFWGIFLLGGLFAFSVRAEDQPVDSLASPQEIIDRLARWQERITTLRIVWEETYHDLDGQLQQPPDRAYSANRVTSEWVWCRDGRWGSHHISYLNDRFRAHEQHADDGEYAYQAVYASADAPRNMPATLKLEGSRTKANGRRLSSRTPYWYRPLTGILYFFEDRWLAERLETDSVETWGYESVGDRALPFVKFNDGGQEILVLDPEVGYLPRIVREGGVFPTVFRVERFEEIEPGFWFPMSGTERTQSYEYPEMNGIRRWTVQKVELNPPVAQTDLQIRPTKGTLVDDRFMWHKFTFGPGMPPDTMANGLNRKMMDWLASGKRGPNPFKPPTPESPESRRTIILAILLLVCIAAFIGSLYWRHQSEAP